MRAGDFSFSFSFFDIFVVTLQTFSVLFISDVS